MNNWDLAFQIGRCLDWRELRLRKQSMSTVLFNQWRYTLIAAWTNDKRLFQHNRSGALWLVGNGVATVVKPNKDIRSAIDMRLQTLKAEKVVGA